MRIFLLFTLFFSLALPQRALSASESCGDSDVACRCTESDGTQTTLTSEDITDKSLCTSACNEMGAISYEFFCGDLLTPVDQGSAVTSTSPAREEKAPVIPSLNVPIPGLDLRGSVVDDGQGSVEVNMIGLYINAIFTYGITLAAIFGVLVLTIAGFQYMTAGGNKNAVAKAKGRMQNTVFGLILLMATYAIAFLIDPRTTFFNALTLKKVPYVEISTENTDRDIGALSLPDPAGGTNGVPYFSQREYDDYTYGSKCDGPPTIATSGCGPTAAAMVLSNLGISTNPVEVAEDFESGGYRICNKGTAYAAFTNSSIIRENGLTGTIIDIQDHAQIEAIVGADHPVIISVGPSRFTSGGHFMVLTGIDSDGNFMLNDPNSGYQWATKEEIYDAIKFAVYIH